MEEALRSDLPRVVTQAGELLCRTENEAFIHLWSMDMDVLSGFRFPPWDWDLGPSHAESDYGSLSINLNKNYN